MGAKIVFKGVDAYAKVLHDVKQKQLKAAITAVNMTAAVARQNAQKLMRKKFTIRNDFTPNSVIYAKCPPGVTKLKDVKSELGLLPKARYMAQQETGGQKRSSTGSNLIIPNTTARLGSNTNTVRKFYRYSNIKTNFHPRVVDGRPSKSKMALAVAAANAAQRRGFIRINNTIFQVFRFQPKKDHRMFIAKPILNLKHSTVWIPARPWMQPAIEYAENLTPEFYKKAMDELYNQ